MSPKIKKLVIDTSALISLVPLWELAEELYTVEEVFCEVREKAARDWLKAFPYQIIKQAPFPENVKFINDFTKKTGDYTSLSLTDVKVLALTYQLEVEAKGKSHLRQEPLPLETRKTVTGANRNVQNVDDAVIRGFYLEPDQGRERTSECSHSEEPVNEAVNICQDFTAAELLQCLNCYFADHSYAVLAVPSSKDLELSFCIKEAFRHIRSEGDLTWPVSKDEEVVSRWPHLVRYLNHMDSFSADEVVGFEHCSLSLEDIIYRIQVQTCNKVQEISEGEDDVSTDEEALQSLEDQLENLGLQNSNTSPGNFFGVPEAKPCEHFYAEAGDDSGQGTGNTDDDVDEGSEEGSENDSDEGWITPSNIKNKKKQGNKTKNGSKYSHIEPEEEFEVACISGDFSIQNVLKHIGLHAMGVDGKMIKRVSTYILRCYACFKTTTKMDRVFCSFCGHKTLKRVSVTLNPDGSQHIWINTKRPINIRGTIFSLPMPKGGHHEVYPLIVADQRIPSQRPTKASLKTNKPLDPDYVAGVSPFMERDVYSRAAQLGIRTGPRNHKGVYYWERKNPNMTMRKKPKKKRRI